MENRLKLRKIARGIFRGVGILLCAILITEGPAHAYLDPGAGSFATQMLIAGAAGALFSFRSLISRVFRSKRSNSKRP
jgi:hypothetical protein